MDDKTVTAGGDGKSSVDGHSTGSVAHQIIGQFLIALEGQNGYEKAAKNLRNAIFGAKPTEASLRFAMFEEDEL